MKRFLAMTLALLLLAPGLFAQASPVTGNAELRQELEQLKKTVTALEERLAAAEKKENTLPEAPKPVAPAPEASAPSNAELAAQVNDLDTRVTANERKSALDRVNFSGDFRSESNSIFGTVPNYYNGMQLQNLMVSTLWLFMPTTQGGLGMTFNPAMLSSMTPTQFGSYLGQEIQQNYAQYQYYTNNLTFSSLKSSLGGFSSAQQAMLQQYLMQVPGVYTAGYQANANAVLTNRLRLNLDAKVAENVSFTGRLSMYKVFGNSTGVQVFNGQPATMSIDGTTATVPSGDMLRVERAYFTWKDIAGSKLYLSIGRRPSTDGPPMNMHNDEPRGGTPSGALINYQFDGVTMGYHLGDKTALRLCYGLGYDAGYGNGQLLQNPADRMRSVHFLGANIDAYSTDKTLIQITMAKAWNVTDGFDGEVVLPVNPVTGQSINSPVILNYTPSTNLGNIFLYGFNAQTKVKSLELYSSLNWDSLRPNGKTSPLGGLGSDPFDTPTNHDGWMGYLGARYDVPQNHGATKLGFEYNHGSKYWFNFAQAEDDILAPKTSVRGNAVEAYMTHRINPHFIFKADYQRFMYQWSGSGWNVGAPHQLNADPVLGFPTYNNANLLLFGLTARF
ncbi:MAG: DUF3373 family protein [Acidobacteriota bacterium]|nr:DUF3373 family protein [Acidobacteriota bacterium]